MMSQTFKHAWTILHAVKQLVSHRQSGTFWNNIKIDLSDDRLNLAKSMEAVVERAANLEETATCEAPGNRLALFSLSFPLKRRNQIAEASQQQLSMSIQSNERRPSMSKRWLPSSNLVHGQSYSWLQPVPMQCLAHYCIIRQKNHTVSCINNV